MADLASLPEHDDRITFLGIILDDVRDVVETQVFCYFLESKMATDLQSIRQNRSESHKKPKAKKKAILTKVQL